MRCAFFLFLQYRYTPLHYAVENHTAEVTKLLIERGADVNAKTLVRLSAFSLGGTCYHNLAAPLPQTKSTPLHHAAWKGAGECCRILLEHGAAINATDDV